MTSVDDAAESTWVLSTAADEQDVSVAAITTDLKNDFTTLL